MNAEDIAAAFDVDLYTPAQLDIVRAIWNDDAGVVAA